MAAARKIRARKAGAKSRQAEGAGSSPRHTRARLRHTRAPTSVIPAPPSVIPAPQIRHTRACRGYLAARPPPVVPGIRRPKLDLGPKQRLSAARRTEMPCKRRSAGHSGPSTLRTALDMAPKSSLVRRRGGARPTTATPAPLRSVIPALRRGYLDERPPPAVPRIRRPKLDLGPKRRQSAARRTGMPCERRPAGHSGPSALRTGFGAVWGAGAALVEIPAAERGYDGGGGPSGGCQRHSVPRYPANAVRRATPDPQRCEQRWVCPPNQVWGDGEAGVAIPFPSHPRP